MISTCTSRAAQTNDHSSHFNTHPQRLRAAQPACLCVGARNEKRRVNWEDCPSGIVCGSNRAARAVKHRVFCTLTIALAMAVVFALGCAAGQGLFPVPSLAPLGPLAPLGIEVTYIS